jgi:hemoglobin-like flavoprotein
MYSFREVWGDQLIKHPQFQLQANRFMSVVVGVVESMDSLSSAICGCPGLVELGRKHVTIKGFLPDYFDVFTRAVLSVWRQELRDSYTTAVGDAWAALFGYIINQLKNGYEDEMRVRQLI